MYRVKILPEALQDAETLFRWLSIDSPHAAVKWFQGLQNTLQKLEYMPARFPLSPESEVVGIEIRHCIYRRSYRILFVIDESVDEHKVVRIHHIRHSAREWMALEEFKL